MDAAEDHHAKRLAEKMTAIERILTTGQSARTEDAPMPHVPFADNGCGDLYCWPRMAAAEPAVLFADHETSYTYSDASASFTQWLEEQRF